MPPSRLLAALASATGVLTCMVLPVAFGSEPLRACWTVPALFILPGLGFARGAANPLDRVVRAVVIATLCGVPLLVLGRHAGSLAMFVAAAGIAAVGWARPAPRGERLATGERLGAMLVGVAGLAMCASGWAVVRLPLDGYWWSAAGEELPEAAEVEVGEGWADVREVGAARVLTPGEGPGNVEMGRGIVVLRGAVGDVLTVDGQVVPVERDPTVDPEEGPVPRYLAAGVASIAVESAGVVTVSDPGRDTVYAIPSAEGLWQLHEAGELRFGHYYQLLNMVEQLRWAREIGEDRWVTDVQPPLWTWPMGLALFANPGGGPGAGEPGGQPTANVLFLYLCGLIGLVGVRAVTTWAPRAPLVAYALPALAVAEHVRLMLEPGSTGLPDTVYTLAVVALVATPSGFGWGVAAQLARYPGTLVSGLYLVLAGRYRDAARLAITIAALVALFGLAGLATGALDGWIETATWETGPEHWHGETSPAVLLARAPTFYVTWLGYAGAAPLLALTGWNRAVRALLGTAGIYSLLLCTIDHFPSHYFLPLLWLSVLACACARPGRFAWRHWLAVAGLAYAVAWVPITG